MNFFRKIRRRIHLKLIITLQVWKNLDKNLEKLHAFILNKNLEFTQTVSKYNFFAQDGEDIFLDEYFKTKQDGFFVDVGSNHPIYLSNTYHLYRKGWRGINIDPFNFNDLYKKYRAEDKFIQKGVADMEGELTLYEYRADALNTLSPDRVAELKEKGISPIAEQTVKVERLESILDKEKVNSIDLMSIDVETMEMGVLNSNNWEKYKPTLILVEILVTDLAAVNSSPVHNFLTQQGYKLIAKLYRTAIYELKEK
jgi:FkbM family methyltransferase